MQQKGNLTARGGMTSHAAVVARGMGTACVAGCGDIKFAEDGKSFTLGGKTVQEGDYISLDGSTGKIYPAKSVQYLQVSVVISIVS